MKQGIPKSVQDLLARQTAGDEHPSADLLNGYMEQSLTASEIAQVTNHLAACGECREIVFLASAVHEEEVVPAVAAAMPAQERQVVAPAGRRKPSWVWWKWAVPAVAVIIVAAGVLVEQHRIPERASPASNTLVLSYPAPSTTTTNRENALIIEPPARLAAKASPVAPTESKKHAAAGARQSAGAEQAHLQQQLALQRSMELAQLSSSLENQRANVVGGAVARGAAPAPPLAKAAPPRSTSQSVAVTSAAPLIQADKADLSTNFDQNVVANAPNGGNDLTYLQKSAASNSGVAGKDQTAPEASLKSGLVSSGQPSAVNKLAKALLPVAHWRISADGHLERALPGNPWTRVLADQPVAFRVVAVVGSNVWAGGNSGALFHSTDQGESWNRVALSLNGQPERSAVVSIHFDNAVQGSLSAASGATWVTSDGGQTWIKR